MTESPALRLSVVPVPDAAAVPALLERLKSDFPLSANAEYMDALRGSAERVGALSLLPPLLRRMGCDPTVMTLGRDAHGRPHLCDTDGLSSVDFNLSHTSGWVGCAVIPAPFRVGVDVEGAVPPARAEKLIRRFATEGERAMLEGTIPFAHTPLSPMRAGHVPDFTTLWTLREAMAKYIGRGEPLRFDASAPPAGVRLWVGHFPADDLRVALCLSGEVRSPVLWADASLSPVADMDILIPKITADSG